MKGQLNIKSFSDIPQYIEPPTLLVGSHFCQQNSIFTKIHRKKVFASNNALLIRKMIFIIQIFHSLLKDQLFHIYMHACICVCMQEFLFVIF